MANKQNKTQLIYLVLSYPQQCVEKKKRRSRLTVFEVRTEHTLHGFPEYKRTPFRVLNETVSTWIEDGGKDTHSRDRERVICAEM